MSFIRPKKGEKKDEFISRGMKNETMSTKYPNTEERLAACQAQWDESKEGKQMDAINTVERRYITMELRLSDDDSDETKIQGYAARFNKWGDGYWFREKIAQGAFKQTLKDKDDVRALFNHNPDLPLGRSGVSGAGKLTLKEDKDGLWMELVPTNTTFANDLMENIRAGVVTQQSFGFEVREDEWTYFDGEKDRQAERILRNVKLYDVSPVTYPFYTDTSVALRSLDKWKVDNNIVEEKADDTTYECECLECSHTMETKEHCDSIECPECGGAMRRVDRPGVGKKSSESLEEKSSDENILAIHLDGLDPEVVQQTIDNLRKADTIETDKTDKTDKQEEVEETESKPESKTITVNIDGIDEQIAQTEIDNIIENLRKTDNPESADSDVHSPSENNPIEDDAQQADEALRRRQQFEFDEEEYNFNNRYRTDNNKSSRY